MSGYFRRGHSGGDCIVVIISLITQIKSPFKGAFYFMYLMGFNEVIYLLEVHIQKCLEVRLQSRQAYL